MTAIATGRARSAAAGLAAAALFAAQPAPGDEIATQLSAHLTGGGQRAWVKTRWESVLATEGPRCVQGEIWDAVCAAGAGVGERVLVTARDGLTLVVEPDSR